MKRPRDHSSDVLCVRTIDKDVAVETITKDLDTFLTPVSRSTFLSEFYNRKALAVKVHPSHRETRLDHVKEVLDQFHPVKMLHASNSEKINVWMADGTDSLHSFKVSAQEAKGCYDGGCGLYFRASEDLESEFVPSFLEALGHQFASVFRDGNRRGEIETFVTHVGHSTNWHYDFQENFTIQLRGAKRWHLYPSGVQHPHRGFAPHFKNVQVLHTQTHIAKCADQSFDGLPRNIDEVCETVVLQPGDVLYHPAGYWHKVETIGVGEDTTNSLSINISLFPQSWGEMIAESLAQGMISVPALRQSVRFDSIIEGQHMLQERLKQAVQVLNSLLPAHVLPESLNEPAGAVRITCKGGVEWAHGNRSSNKSTTFSRSLLGSLQRTASTLEVPLLQRPVEDGSSADSDDDGSVEVPKGFARFDYHSNFIAEEAHTGVPPAVHVVMLVEHALVEDFVKLSKVRLGAKMSATELPSVKGLASFLLHIGFLA